MSSVKHSRVARNALKPMVVALALALPGTASLAATMSDVVTTRDDQNVAEQYGRDSVYAFSRDAKPFKPEQQGQMSDGNFIGNAFHKTAGFFTGAWHKTTSLFTGHDDGHSGASRTVMAYEPQRYGRAGGYTGSDRVEVIGEGNWYGTTATANAQDVKTGQALQDGAAANSTVDQTAPQPAPSADNSATSSPGYNTPSSDSTVAAPVTTPATTQDQSAVTTPDQSSSPADTSAARENRDSTTATDQQPAIVRERVIERETIVQPVPVPNGSDNSSAVAPQSTEQSPSDQSTTSGAASQPDQGMSNDNVVRSPGTSESGRTEGTRFDNSGNADSAHGQQEIETQTR